jgi:coproporphyrinogen III oxidase-like Fe-S oxidoreductase
LRDLVAKLGEEALADARATVVEFVKAGLMERRDDYVYLTARGRLLSNEVFERFIFADEIAR